RQARSAQSVEESGVRVVLREVAVRASVGERQDRLAAVLVARPDERLRHERQGFVPGRLPESRLPLLPLPDPRDADAAVAVDELGEAADLGADVALRDRVDPRPAESLHAAVGDRHVEAAGVRAVEGTDPGNVGAGLRLRPPNAHASPPLPFSPSTPRSCRSCRAGLDDSRAAASCRSPSPWPGPPASSRAPRKAAL